MLRFILQILHLPLTIQSNNYTMKRIFMLAALFSNVCFAQQQNDWENPALVQQNKEKPHTTAMLFTNAADVKTDDYSKSPFYQSLNGTWKFIYTDR